MPFTGITNTPIWLLSAKMGLAYVSEILHAVLTQKEK
jgi:hypothetical protein